MSLLTRDIDNLRDDARSRVKPDLSDEVFTHALRDLVNQFKETFATYGVPYNEDTVKAAAATLIWSTSAAQGMFAQGVPVHIEQSPLSYAVHGGLVAMNVVFQALDEINT